jgi:putative ABC transport system permease protein
VRIFARLISLVRNLTRRDRVEADLDDELRATVEMLAAEKIRSGIEPDAARRAALIQFGGIEPLKEQIRDARSGSRLDTLAQDVRYAVRLLRRYPLFAVTAAVSLAVGIGANTAVFTIGNSLLRFSPTAVSDPDRLVDFGRSFDGLAIGFNPGSYPDYLDVRRRTTTLEHVYAHPLFPQSMTLASQAGTEKVSGELVTTNYFAALGTRPALGRLFLADESDQQGASPFIVLSHRLWVLSFKADPTIVGQTIRLNRQPVTVVGVAPEGFQGTTIVAVDLWVPMSMLTRVLSSTSPGTLEARNAGWFVMGARLKPGATVQQASAELDAIDRSLREEYPGQIHPQPFRVLPASPMADKMPLAAAALILLAAVASTVLVIACANVAGLLLARASARRREMALRLAVGAVRSRLIRQLLTETAVLFVIGAAAGVALAKVMTSALVSLLPALPIPVHMSPTLDWQVVLLTCGLSLVAAVVSGLAPALNASRADVSTVLKDESHGASTRLRTRSAFVVAQVALSLVLIVVGGLFTRALQQATSTDAGFDARGVDVASIDASLVGDDEGAGLSFLRDLTVRVRELPGVQSASLARMLPLASEGYGIGLSLPGAVRGPGEPDVAGSGNIVGPGYFDVMRIPLRTGRDFTEQDAAGAPLVAVVGEAAARRFWPNEDPVGKQLVVNGAGVSGEVVQVVGVAQDLRYRTLDFGSVPFVYLPLRQHYMPNVTLVVRSANGRSTAGQVRATVAQMSTALPPLSILTLENAVAVNLTPQRIGAFVSGSLGLIGVLLAAIGIYGVTAYAVAHRTREIAIRTALGAQRGTVVRLVVRQAISLTAIGCGIGVVLGALAGQVLSMLLVGVSPLDPVALAAGVGLCVGVTFAACVVPVSRAIRVEASDALRSE